MKPNIHIAHAIICAACCLGTVFAENMMFRFLCLGVQIGIFVAICIELIELRRGRP